MSYAVRAEPVFGSDRWRWVITSEGATGSVVVASSQGTYANVNAAKLAGGGYARAMVRQLRKDFAK